MQDTTHQRSPDHKDKPTPIEIPDIATEPHPTGPIDLPGLSIASGRNPDDELNGTEPGPNEEEESEKAQP
jgi:hypothetical protein